MRGPLRTPLRVGSRPGPVRTLVVGLGQLNGGDATDRPGSLGNDPSGPSDASPAPHVGSWGAPPGCLQPLKGVHLLSFGSATAFPTPPPLHDLQTTLFSVLVRP
eukprot:scaffold313_cov378-Pavlova_lutheri.AAC.12